MDEDERAMELVSPSFVSFVPLYPSIAHSWRGLCCIFTNSNPILTSRRNFICLSLQEATCTGNVGRGLEREAAIAWELFSPIHRVLIVAILAAASANSKKNWKISQLQTGINHRDKLLSGMQQKLDDLCEKMSSIKDRTEARTDMQSKNVKNECWHCDQHHIQSNDGSTITENLSSDEIFTYKATPETNSKPEERRMSDLSDWSSSGSSSVETQASNLVLEQNVVDLRKECEQKDSTIRELAALLHSSDNSHSKKITELEDMASKKNHIIANLKKDLEIMEQKLVHLTRAQRPSSSSSSSSIRQLPFMASNILYDMDSSTNSSSDSDTTLKKQSQLVSAKAPKIVDSSSTCQQQSKKVGDALAIHPKQTNKNLKSKLDGNSSTRSKRRKQSKLKDVAPQRKWV